MSRYQNDEEPESLADAIGSIPIEEKVKRAKERKKQAEQKIYDKGYTDGYADGYAAGKICQSE
jgi:hypothetical protein